MIYKYIMFKMIKETAKTKIWNCFTNKGGQHLGTVKWYGPWRQYCYFPQPETVFNAGCLADIQSFLNAQMKERKNSRGGI